MKIRMRIAVTGTFHDMENVAVGDVVEVPDEDGARYCAHGYAEPVAEGPNDSVETATPPEPEKRTDGPTVPKPPASRRKKA